MNRRKFLRCAGATWAAIAIRNPPLLHAEVTRADSWRTFEVTTRVEVLTPAGATRMWLPAPLGTETVFQKTLANEFIAEGGKARFIKDKADEPGIVSADFPSGVKPVLTLTNRVSTKNYVVNLLEPNLTPAPDRAELDYFRQPTRLLPTDGIVKTTAAEITSGANSDIEKARAIYEWIVDNTFRDPKVRGCGTGNIRFMLESRNLSGKCADLSALYVGLARAAGLPARDVYGIRLAKSELGYKSLGPSAEDISKAQHCRAEVYISSHGWVPVDPADVRKVVLEEPPGNRTLDDDLVKRARARLFGAWEMNWLAYNYAHDVSLPGSAGSPLSFFMYPQAETEAGRLDSLDAGSFSYKITSREIQTTVL